MAVRFTAGLPATGIRSALVLWLQPIEKLGQMVTGANAGGKIQRR